MFIDRLLSDGGTTSVLEKELTFTEARQQVLSENIANVDVPGYRQKDLSVEKFQSMLREKLQEQGSAPPGSVNFDDVEQEVEHPANGILFHDGNNRSMEQMMSDNAKNALMHNVIVELLRDQYSGMEMALKERVS